MILDVLNGRSGPEGLDKFILNFGDVGLRFKSATVSVRIGESFVPQWELRIGGFMKNSSIVRCKL
jgi:hypothetical protein